MADMKAHTIYSGGYSPTDTTVRMFWKVTVGIVLEPRMFFSLSRCDCCMHQLHASYNYDADDSRAGFSNHMSILSATPSYIILMATSWNTEVNGVISLLMDSCVSLKRPIGSREPSCPYRPPTLRMQKAPLNFMVNCLHAASDLTLMLLCHILSARCVQAGGRGI